MSRKIMDLSVASSNSTEGISVTLRDNRPVYVGHECYGYDLVIKSHTGTYFETSSHVFREGKNTDQVPINELILPGMCVKITHNHRSINANDLENACEAIEPGSALLIDVGKDTDKYFSLDAAQWMAEKEVAVMGSNTKRYDNGFENPTGFFIDLFKAEIPIIANLTNLNLLPVKDFTVIILPLHITGVCTVPCRVVCVLTEQNNIK